MVTTSQMLAKVDSRGRVGVAPWLVNKNFKDVAAAGNMEEAIKAAGLDYTVEKQQLMLANGQAAAGYFGLVRPDTNQVYGVVGNVYKPVQNTERFSFFDEYLATGQVKLEHAGYLDGGAKVSIVARFDMPDVEIAPGDAIAKYILLTDTFDGKSALKVSLMTLRLICGNGAVSTDNAAFFTRLRHNRHTTQRLEDAKLNIGRADEDFGRVIEQYRQLAASPIKSESLLRQYIRTVFDFQEKEYEDANGNKIKGLSPRAGNILDDVVGRAESKTNRGANLTYWSAFNGVTEYLNHDYGHGHETRLDNLWYGKSNKLIHAALKVAFNMAA